LTESRVGVRIVHSAMAAPPGHNEYIVSEDLVTYHERANGCILCTGILAIISATVLMFFGFGLDSSFKSDSSSIDSQGLVAIAAVSAAVLAVLLSASQSSSCCFDVSRRPGHNYSMGGCCFCRTMYRSLMVCNIIFSSVTAVATCVVAGDTTGMEGVACYSTALLLVIIAVDQIIAIYLSRKLTSGEAIDTPLRAGASSITEPFATTGPDHTAPVWKDLRSYYKKLYADHGMDVPEELSQT